MLNLCVFSVKTLYEIQIVLTCIPIFEQSDGKMGKTVSEQNEVAWRVNSNLAQMFVLIWEPIKIQSVSQRVLAFHILGMCFEKSKQTKTLKSWVLIIKIRQITWENCEKWTKVRTLKFCAEISEFFCHSDFTWNKFWKFKKF